MTLQPMPITLQEAASHDAPLKLDHGQNQTFLQRLDRAMEHVLLGRLCVHHPVRLGSAPGLRESDGPGRRLWELGRGVEQLMRGLLRAMMNQAPRVDRF